MMILDELLHAVGKILPQLFSLSGLELFGQAVVPLSNVVLSFLFCQFDFAYTKVGSPHIESEEFACFIAVWKSHDPSRNHWLLCRQKPLASVRPPEAHNVTTLLTQPCNELSGQPDKAQTKKYLSQVPSQSDP